MGDKDKYKTSGWSDKNFDNHIEYKIVEFLNIEEVSLLKWPITWNYFRWEIDGCKRLSRAVNKERDHLEERSQHPALWTLEEIIRNQPLVSSYKIDSVMGVWKSLEKKSFSEKAKNQHKTERSTILILMVVKTARNR